MGTLKHHIKKDFNNLTKDQEDFFLGSKNVQSHFIISDVSTKKIAKIDIRDGITIDNRFGIAKKGAKYDYEVVDPGTEFDLKMEINLRKGMKNDDLKIILKTITEELKKGDVLIGAMTTKGFGRIQLNDFKIYEFNFPKDGERWFKFINGEGIDPIMELSLIDHSSLDPKPLSDFKIDAKFYMKSSFIIGAYPTNPNEPDKIHIKSNGKPVLTGTSLKGAIRARGLKIINSFGGNGEEILKKTFGWADTEEKSKVKYKSRILIEESVISDVDEVVQKRIKIDRFTQGTLNRALFESEPLWHKDEKINMKIKLKDAEEWEAGLLLLILKDLWNEDLPLGGEKNIGRGIFLGIKTVIDFKGEPFEITSDNGKLNIKGDRKKLEGFVMIFIKKIGGR